MENLKTIELKVTVSYKVEDGRIPYEEAEWASAIDLAISSTLSPVIAKRISPCSKYLGLCTYSSLVRETHWSNQVLYVV